MKVDIYNKTGKKEGSQDLPGEIFGLDANDALVYQVFTVKLANRRRPYAHTKTRADKRGGGRKPWRQKGTGRARHGSIRSPLWRGGGVTFGPRNDRAYGKKINKKMNKKAIATVLSSKAKAGNVYVVKAFDWKELKTKKGVSLLGKMKVDGASIIVYGTKEDDGYQRVFNNIPGVKPVNIDRINIVDLLNNKVCVFSQSALDKLVKQYAK
ncbi:MAG: 50S ribosomal protein L4 [Candidatus Spechtbacterales bacterium]|nr:50S ribosomal protein L4 [Candidatus Spechtbacterales bacterium]